MRQLMRKVITKIHWREKVIIPKIGLLTVILLMIREITVL